MNIEYRPDLRRYPRRMYVWIAMVAGLVGSIHGGMCGNVTWGSKLVPNPILSLPWIALWLISVPNMRPLTWRRTLAIGAFVGFFSGIPAYLGGWCSWPTGLAVSTLMGAAAAAVIRRVLIAYGADWKGPPYCRCGYDLTSNESGTCPECGTKITDDMRISYDERFYRNVP